MKNRKRLPILMLLLMAAVFLYGCSSQSGGSPVTFIEGDDGPTSVFLAGTAGSPSQMPAMSPTPSPGTKGQHLAAEDPPQEAAEKEMPAEPDGGLEKTELSVEETYGTKELVAAYIHAYGKLPSNYIKKKEAEALGWDSRKGNLWDVAPGKAIGGDAFGNREKRLPTKDGRVYYECDVNYEGGFRGADRLVYSNDGLIYYTEDHYESFTLLYGEPENKK